MPAAEARARALEPAQAQAQDSARVQVQVQVQVRAQVQVQVQVQVPGRGPAMALELAQVRVRVRAKMLDQEPEQNPARVLVLALALVGRVPAWQKVQVQGSRRSKASWRRCRFRRRHKLRAWRPTGGPTRRNGRAGGSCLRTCGMGRECETRAFLRTHSVRPTVGVALDGAIRFCGVNAFRHRRRWHDAGETPCESALRQAANDRLHAADMNR
jgi:hypothetical protein